MQRSTKSIWGAGFAFTGLGLLLFTLNAEPARSALGSATGTVTALAPMKTGHRLALAGHAGSFGFVLRAPGCEDLRGILSLQGKTATLLYQKNAMIPASEPPYFPVYAVYQGDTPLCSYEAVRRAVDRQKQLTRLLSWGAFGIGALFLASAWRQRPSPRPGAGQPAA